MKKILLFTFAIGAMGIKANGQTRITNNPILIINAGNSVTCSGGGIITTDNSFYHVYDLDNYANIVDTAFFIRMLVGAEGTTGGAYNIVGRVHTLVGAPSIANITLITSDTIAIYPDSSMYRIPIFFDYGYAFPGDSLASELHLPANTTASFYPASNTSPESSPTYIVASGCSINDFTTTADVGFPTMHLIMNLYVNQKPTMSGISSSTFKDNQLVFTETDFTTQFTDNDNDGLTMVKVVTIPSNGDLDLSGTTLAVGDTVYTSDLGNLKYFPGTGYFGPDSFSIIARDTSHWTNTAAVIDIDVINWQVSINELENSSLAIYPNPANAQITIQIADLIQQIRILDAQGKTVFMRVSDDAIIDISKLQNGNYFIEVKTEKATYHQQFIKQ